MTQGMWFIAMVVVLFFAFVIVCKWWDRKVALDTVDERKRRR